MEDENISFKSDLVAEDDLTQEKTTYKVIKLSNALDIEDFEKYMINMGYKYIWFLTKRGCLKMVKILSSACTTFFPNYQLFLPMDIGVNISESSPVRLIIKLWKNWTIEINANIL